MADIETKPSQEVVADSKKKTDRSPSFPAIGLTKAVERVQALFAAAKRHEMRIGDVATAWGTGAKSSGTLQAIAALIAFGLVEDSGSGDARKFKVTDLAFKALEDQRPGAREAALAEAALTPKLIAEYAEKWRDGRPADGICTSELRIDRGFTEEGAKTFLRVFDDTISYAKQPNADKKIDTTADKKDEAETPSQAFTVGDLVQVEAGGVIAFEKVAVRAVQELDGQTWIFVEGSETGAPMSDVTLLEKSPPPSAAPPKLPLNRVIEQTDDKDAGVELDRFTVDEGVVKITFPSGMTAASVDELEDFLKLFIKKAKRRAGAQNPK